MFGSKGREIRVHVKSPLWTFNYGQNYKPSSSQAAELMKPDFLAVCFTNLTSGVYNNLKSNWCQIKSKSFWRVEEMKNMKKQKFPFKTKVKYEKGKLSQGLVNNEIKMNIIKYSLTTYIVHVCKEYKNVLQNLWYLTWFFLSSHS